MTAFRNFGALENRINNIIGCDLPDETRIFVRHIVIASNSFNLEIVIVFDEVFVPKNLLKSENDTLRFDLDILDGSLVVQPRPSSIDRGEIEMISAREIIVSMGQYTYKFGCEKIRFQNFRTNCFRNLIDSNWSLME